MRNTKHVVIGGLLCAAFCAVALLACKPLGGNFDEWQEKAKEKNLPFTVTFEANGGDPKPAAVRVAKGGKVKEPSIYYDDYTFDGWYTDNETFENWWNFAIDTVTKNITLYARWTGTVTFSGNRATSGTPPSDLTANAGSSITLPSGSGLTRSGYTFGGWNTQNDGYGTNYAVGASYPVTGDVTLYAKWIVAGTGTYVVTYVSNGGSGTASATQTVTAGSSIALRGQGNLTRTGYAFDGWNTSAAGTGMNYAANSSYMVTGNVTLYARWVYTITFDINNGSGRAPATQTPVASLSITLPGGDGLTRTGYTFGGWNTNSSGTGMNYAAGASYTGTGNITLYAKWIAAGAATYTVIFILNGGSGTAPATQTAAAGSSITLASGSGLYRSGYTFGGWNTNTYGTGTTYAAGTSYEVTYNVTLYARWVYAVTYDINGGTGTTPAAQTAPLGSTITLPSGSGLTRTGYAFGGWNTSADGTGNNYAANSSYTITGNVTLYARWIINYTVTFSVNSGSGTAPAAQTVTSGSNITLPYDSGFYRDGGYTFGGWNTSAAGTGTNYSAGSSYTPTSNVTLYARWFSIYAPGTPTGVTATAASTSSITVSWSSVSEATGYYVYRSTSASGTYNQVGTSSSTSYTNTGLSAGTTYYYRVSAYNSYGESAQSSGYAYATTTSALRTVTIDMYDSYGDGWDNGGALRINKNGVQFATNVRVSSGYSNTYTFSVVTGDVIQIYWVVGSNQNENSFIVYYTNTPPSPAFTSSNNSTWSGSNALVYRRRGTMDNISNNTLLGSFTVQ